MHSPSTGTPGPLRGQLMLKPLQHLLCCQDQNIHRLSGPLSVEHHLSKSVPTLHLCSGLPADTATDHDSSLRHSTSLHHLYSVRSQGCGRGTYGYTYSRNIRIYVVYVSTKQYYFTGVPANLLTGHLLGVRRSYFCEPTCTNSRH